MEKLPSPLTTCGAGATLPLVRLRMAPTDTPAAVARVCAWVRASFTRSWSGQDVELAKPVETCVTNWEAVRFNDGVALGSACWAARMAAIVSFNLLTGAVKVKDHCS